MKSGREVSHCSRLGFETLSNGKLLSAAEAAGFQVIVTVDKSIEHQQNMSGRSISVIYLRASMNKVEILASMGDMVLDAINSVGPTMTLTILHPDW